MIIDDVMSGVANLVCGVPHGSVLGPLKLCLYLLPLGAIMRYHSIGYHIYADDTQLYISFKCNTLIVFRSLQAKQYLSGLSIIVGDNIIQQSSNINNLGIIFYQFLSFEDYISSVCRSTYFHLRNIGRIRHLLSQNATAQHIHVLISIHHDYCNSVLYNLPKNSILRLQIILNQDARILTKTPRRDHITEVLIDLHWLKIEERIVYKLLILTFKAFIDRTATLYLCELIEQQKSSANTRLVNDAFILKLPTPSRNFSDTFFERSFTCVPQSPTLMQHNPYEWNKLDERVRRVQTTQPISDGAVTAVTNCGTNCVEPSRLQQWVPDLPFFGQAGHADPLDAWRCS